MPWKGKPGHGSTYTQIILASLRYCEVMHIAFKYQSKRYHTKYFEIASSSSFMRCTHICVCVCELCWFPHCSLAQFTMEIIYGHIARVHCFRHISLSNRYRCVLLLKSFKYTLHSCKHTKRRKTEWKATLYASIKWKKPREKYNDNSFVGPKYKAKKDCSNAAASPSLKSNKTKWNKHKNEWYFLVQYHFFPFLSVGWWWF